MEKRPLIPTVRSLKEFIRWLKELQKSFSGCPFKHYKEFVLEEGLSDPVVILPVF